MEYSHFKEHTDRVVESCSQVIVGKEETVRLIFISFLCSGHVLLEDVPGTGKTMLLKAFARTVGSGFKRIQFTPDLLPSDLTGINFLYSDSLPQVEVNSDLMWMDLEDSTLVLNASSHERYVYIREMTPADASLTAAVANIRVGLFKNQKLAAWAEPCEKPDSFHGFEEFDFYQLPELRLSLTPADTVQVAAVVTDIYGRVTVSQDVPYILDESGDALTWPDSSETDPDPAHWQYGG